ncbi:CBN-UGT-47 protein, partial [Aphelenchoides avenae]
LILEAEFGTRTRDMQPPKLARRRVLTEFNVTIFREFTSGITSHTFDEGRWPLDTYTAHGSMLDGANYQCEELLKHTEVLEELKAEKFDIIITGMLYFCGAGLKEVLDIKAHVGLNSSPMLDHIAWLLGMPLEQSYVPAVIGDLEVSDDMSYLDRPSFPDVSDIVRDSALLLVCVDELVDFPRPLLPNVVYIGGVGMGSPNKELPKDFEAEMTKGRSGTVFFSLGTGMDTSTMPAEFLQNVFHAFDQFPDYHFIVKAGDSDKLRNIMALALQLTHELASNRSNVFITSWAPQNDLLAHPRMRAFVSHGGYNSLLESAKNGVPILVMPFFADQFRNAQLVQRNGWGIAFDKRLLLHSPQEFVDALRALLTDE